VEEEVPPAAMAGAAVAVSVAAPVAVVARTVKNVGTGEGKVAVEAYPHMRRQWLIHLLLK